MTLESTAAIKRTCYKPCVSGLKDTLVAGSAACRLYPRDPSVQVIPDQSMDEPLRNSRTVPFNSLSDKSKSSNSSRNKAVLHSVPHRNEDHSDSSYRDSVKAHYCVTLLYRPVILIYSLIRLFLSDSKLSSRSYCWWHTCLLVTSQIILLFPVSSNCSTDVTCSSVNAAIENFSPTERRTFSGTMAGDVWFHYMNVDPRNPQFIYVGGVDYVYKLDVTDISKGPVRSINISQSSTAQANYSAMYNVYVANCRRQSLASRNVDLNYECRNHIRVIQPISSNNELYICSTGSQNPQEFYMNADTLELTYVGYVSSSINGGGSGLSKCPYSPDIPSISLFSDQGSPRNASVLYSGTLALQDYRYSLYRSNVGRNLRSDQMIVSLSTSDAKETLKNDMNYVAVYDIDQYVYFFFREIAIEFTDYDKIFVSRVGRICKNDEGGDSFTNGNFMTYVKTRIVCPSDSQSKTPFYYNEIADVWYDTAKRTFYGLFRANGGNLGSAVCVFSLNVINKQFDEGQFYVLDQGNSKWSIETKVPSIRPSSCAYNRTISFAAQSFAVNHVLMYGAVQPITVTPPFQSNQFAYLKMLAEIRQGYPLLYLYDDTRPLEIARMVLWSEGDGTPTDWKSGGTGGYSMLTTLKPFSMDDGPMWQMILNAGLQKSWLFAVKDSAVTQLTLNVCTHYTTCTSCAADPYCSWNIATNTCGSYSTGSSMIQDARASFSACSLNCKKTTKLDPVIPEMSYLLTCTSYCQPEGDVTWTLNNVQISPSLSSDYVTTRNNDLIVLRASQQTTGTYRCMSGTTILTEISVSLKANDLKGLFLTEYSKWCSEFETYRKSYDQWVCLKNACLSSGDQCIIDQQSIASCQKL